MGADSLAKNTPNDSKFISPKCLPKPKRLVFQWASVVRAQFGCGISKMVGPKKQDFGPKISKEIIVFCKLT
jgi:hypothetical protein